MENKIKILIVEDEMIIGAKISMQLSELGYEVTGIIPRGEEAILHILENKLDIVLLDIHLKGKMDGIETATQLQNQAEVSIIYLTANADEATFNRAKLTKPAGFIAKPFKQLDLQRAIELAVSRMGVKEMNANDEAMDNLEQPTILSDRIFIRHKEKMVKIMLADILFIEADRNYSHIFTKDKEYVLAITLKSIEEKLPMQSFMRVHRSYLINLIHIDEVIEGYIVINVINKKSIPLGAGMREQLLKRIQSL
ncbi:MAG: LytTR family transcriptional regulator DNA-binding domain-containing protein [Microscillaceae bacterium]|jgi:DNA-binding LytR/AlgR family response regulator|nr:LytTR family transcriptional regulator DNA-binding domain-containing protein [Microscillaceae bacterium]